MIRGLYGPVITLGQGTLSPLVNTNTLGPVYATYSDGSTGPALYQDTSGNIVDADDSVTDGYTGDLYSDEITVPYFVGQPSTPPSASPGTTPSPVSSPTPPTTTQAPPAPQIPSGSVIQYTAAWTVTDPIAGVTALMSASSVISALSSQLPSYGMSLQSTVNESNGPANYSIQVNILDTVGHNLTSDALSVISSIVQGQLGAGVVWVNSPTLSIVSKPGSPTSPTTSSTTTPAPTSPISSTLLTGETGLLIGVAVVGVLIVLVMVKK